MAFKKKELEDIEEKEDAGDEEEDVPVPKPSSKKQQESGWEVARVPSEYGIAIVNKKTEEVLDVNSALAKILNDLEVIKKAI